MPSNKNHGGKPSLNHETACRSRMAWRTILAFAASAVLAVASVRASVVAVRACGPTSAVAAAVCAELPAAGGRTRRAARVFAAPADVSARCAAAPRFAAGGADRVLAGAFRPARDGRLAVSAKEYGLGCSVRHSVAGLDSRSGGSEGDLIPQRPGCPLGRAEHWRARLAGRGSPTHDEADHCRLRRG